MTRIGSANHRRRSLLLGAVLTALLVFGPAPRATAQEAEITTPAPMTSFPVDEPFTVAGSGCPAGATVTLEAAGVETTTTADDNGDFSTTMTLPSDAFDPDAERFDVNEIRISGDCDGTRVESGTLVPEFEEASQDDATQDDQSQVEQVPVGGVDTGAGGTAAGPTAIPALALTALLSIGAALTRRGRTDVG